MSLFILRSRPATTFLTFAALCLFCCSESASEQPWKIGFGKADLTPTEPLRLSGYATRIESHETIADSLSARAMVLSPAESSSDAESVILASIDSIAVTSSMTVDLATWLENKYGIPRRSLVLSSTHSHAAPHIHGGLNNLYQVPSSIEQENATKRYADHVQAAVRKAIVQAMEARTNATLAIGDGEANFAVQRRSLKDGKWVGFGERPSGPVDHRVRVMRATANDGKLLGAAFLYACHCTTLGPDFNQVSGDWAGLAASRLEQGHHNAIFLPIIGCGADANPMPRGTYEYAQKHAVEMVDSVNAVLNRNDLIFLSSFPTSHFGYAGLVPEQPTSEHVQNMAKSQQPNEKRWGESMIAIAKEKGRLPETYPMPIHTWQFGNELTWIFLGGEVVVDYQFHIEKELSTRATWVAAYSDDVFAYVPSESMRPEGGYEVDFSMIYYLQPGRWESGTQALIVRRVREILNQSLAEERPLNAEEALASIRVPDGFRVDLVASEPMVQDPINLAFGADGKVWVVEMADYPLGTNGGGRVKWLRDNDHDGTMDHSQLFLDGLSYPTSVLPYGEGAFVINAPDVFFAADRDGDGRAEFRETLLTGIHEANPQHRASGFEWGLEGWVHLTTGEGTKQLTSTRNGQRYEVHGRDIAWHPITGEVRTTSGQTQFVRSRDPFGNWFGNTNNEPMFHYVIEDRYLKQQPISGETHQHLLTPRVAPPVMPRSRTLDRFNDVYTQNRFTSACSSTIVRVPGIPTTGNSTDQIGLICEPVHNLVARISIANDGSTFTATRHPEDKQFDFFTSTDPWSRPVRVVNSPDGSIWIVDMVRQVIEHPQWIPAAWQERIDLRGGSNLGRIYRVYHESQNPNGNLDLSTDSNHLLSALASSNGALRDLVSLRLMDADHSDLAAQVRRLATENPDATIRATALGCLLQKSWLTVPDLIAALSDKDPRIVRLALEFSERWSDSNKIPSDATELIAVQDAILRVVPRDLGPHVDLQWILTSTLFPQLNATDSLTSIATRSGHDVWIAKALSLVSGEDNAFAAATGLFDSFATNESPAPNVSATVEKSLLSLWKRSSETSRTKFALDRLSKHYHESDHTFGPRELLLLSVISQTSGNTGENAQPIRDILARARQRMLSDSVDEDECISLISLIGCGLVDEAQESQDLKHLLIQSQIPKVRQAALEAARRLKSNDVATILIDQLPTLASEEQRTACATLMSRNAWLAELANSLESGKTQVKDLDLATVQQLRSLSNSTLRARFSQVFGRPSERSAVVTAYLEKLSVAVETVEGEKLYREHCATCHDTVKGKSALGPTLTNLGQWTLDQWATAIMNPNQAVEPKYLQSSVLTTDGRVLAGIVQGRTAQTMRLALSDGTVQELSINDIDSIQESKVSLMPEGFETKLTTDQFSQLLGYLRSNAGESKQ